jgi:hypothetical protein
MYRRCTMISRKWLAGLALGAVLVGGTGVASAAGSGAERSVGSGTQRFIVSIDAVGDFAYHDSGVFSVPIGASEPGPLLPGNAYTWKFHAGPGDRLSFASMIVQSNDWFVGPDEFGIPLYRNGAKMTGDVTSYVGIWDAGTEGDELPGEGLNQAPRQAGPDTGPPDPTGYVRQVLTDLVPPVEELVRVTLQDAGHGTFVLRVENISGGSGFPTPLAPGVGVVHTDPAPLFINGSHDYGMGLEGLAEDGDAGPLATVLGRHTGVNTLLAPVAYAVHQGPSPVFATGQRASHGLERLAEDGGPMDLLAELSGLSGAAAVGRGADGPGPIAPPHGNYSFEIVASPGDYLSLAAMFVQSNDWFFALQDQPLFDAAGRPISGNFTHVVHLYDAGTEVNEPIGFGPNQAPRQPRPNTGASEGGVVQQVTQMPYGDAASQLHMTITAVP